MLKCHRDYMRCLYARTLRTFLTYYSLSLTCDAVVIYTNAISLNFHEPHDPTRTQHTQHPYINSARRAQLCVYAAKMRKRCTFFEKNGVGRDERGQEHRSTKPVRPRAARWCDITSSGDSCFTHRCFSIRKKADIMYRMQNIHDKTTILKTSGMLTTGR